MQFFVVISYRFLAEGHKFPVIAPVICIPGSLGIGNSRACNFSIFKALLSLALWGQICGKIPAKSPRSPKTDIRNNVEGQLGDVP